MLTLKMRFSVQIRNIRISSFTRCFLIGRRFAICGNALVEAFKDLFERRYSIPKNKPRGVSSLINMPYAKHIRGGF